MVHGRIYAGKAADQKRKSPANPAGHQHLKRFADLLILGFINFWIRYGFLCGVNKTAKHSGIEGYQPIFEFWRVGRDVHSCASGDNVCHVWSRQTCLGVAATRVANHSQFGDLLESVERHRDRRPVDADYRLARGVGGLSCGFIGCAARPSGGPRILG